ncbi:MAG: type I secretion system permease/ATPase [Pseudomonadota bacterium]
MATRKQQFMDLLGAFRGVFWAVFAMSGVVNVLALTGSFYMLNVYDRVLSSGSVPTLVALSILAAGLFLVQGCLDVLRSQVLVRIGMWLDREASPLAHDALLSLPLFGQSASDAVRPVRDVEVCRSFLSGQGPVAILDMPWMPLYLAFVYFLHPWLGLLATCGVLVLVSLTLLTEVLSNEVSRDASAAATQRMNIADSNARNAEVLKAMGFGDRASQRFAEASEEHIAVQTRASDITGSLSGVSRVARMCLQSAVLGLGAYLALQHAVSPGAIIAASIATARALAPIELAIGNWRAFVGARQGYARLKRTLSALSDEADPIDLPAPSRRLVIENAFVTVPGTQRLILSNVSCQLGAGDGLGVIGPSGSGKSTLVRAIVGAWPLARGAVRLDGAAIDRWPLAYFSSHIGYLPQDVALMDGSIAANIARFDPEADSRAIIEAAQSADVHELILRLPEGYETQLGPSGTNLSAGQRQRIALARALYREPFLIVLDEPNANLDAEGDAALSRAIDGVRMRGGIVVVVAHRPSALQAVNLVAFVSDGQLAKIGPRDQILKEVLHRPQATA